MGRKSVAVLDIRSSEVGVFVGEQGVNRTIVFTASKSEPYDGYEGGKFFDENGLKEAIFKAVSAVEQMCGERLRTLYVGVPGEFTVSVPKERNIGFPKKRRISPKDVQLLFDGGKEEMAGYRLIRATSMIYVTADNRRVVDPVGLSSSSLSGLLTYFYCSEYFAGVLESAFANMKISLRFLPTAFAMAAYLIPPETRDEYALFLDAGYLSSTFLVLLGNGVLAQRNCWCGKGQIAALLMERFRLPYDAAVALLSRANLYVKSNAGKTEFIHRGISYEIDVNEFVDAVKEGLDGLCEALTGFLEECTGRELEYKPLCITGEGLTEIRGALEHVTKRVNRVCEQLAPDLPYYNKPEMSSRIALIDMASDDSRKSGAFHRFFNVIGG